MSIINDLKSNAGIIRNRENIILLVKLKLRLQK